MEKTYVFDNADSGMNTSAILASLMQNKGLDPNLMAMLTNASRNQDAWGGGGCWWVWVIIMFWLWGGRGNGLFGNSAADGIPNQLNNDWGREVLLQAINGNGQAISQLATTLNCDVNSIQSALNNIQGTLGMTGQQIINSVQQSTGTITTQMSQCCCDIKDSITRTNYENQLSNVNQTNALQSAINFVNSSVERGFSSTAYATAQQTSDLKKAISDQSVMINDKFCQLEMREMQNKIDALRQENNQLALAASQQAQTANIINQVRPTPSPAYVVANPYCGCNNYGYSTGCSNC